MKIKIQFLNSKSMKGVLEPILKEKGFDSYSEFAKLVMKKTGGTEHSELNSISNIMKGQTNRVTPVRAKAYAEILGISEKDLLAFCTVGSYYKTKPIMIEDDVDVTTAIKNLATQNEITLADLIKELLYLSHQ